ncbi:ABC transporter permease [Termitidicoccus mucosus]|uniref:MlaE family ABC transporter permease n=1 Tax=Termitidicoccus mucosus TaxID=1184151 RepID=UPI0008382951
MSRSQASIQTNPDSGEACVSLSGDWQITGVLPSWPLLAKQMSGGDGATIAVTTLAFDMSRVGVWDTSLVLFVNAVRQWCGEQGVRFSDSGLSSKVLALLGDVSKTKVPDTTDDHCRDLPTTVGMATLHLIDLSGQLCRFVIECARSALWLAARPGKLRWRDCVFEMQQCGVMGLPIVGLISFLTGVILAYVASTILRQYGADIFVADFVSLVMVREMGAMMTGVVLAGRTGAAFAAQIANMKAGEEIDALMTLGVRPVDFLVIPRILALGVMMPLLALYSNALGILGGLVIAMVVLDIPAAAYWVEMLTAIDLSDIGTGLIKAVTFGMIVGMAGCLRGLQAQRNAAGVGRAATSAVVTAILFIIMSDAVFAVLFNFLGW